MLVESLYNNNGRLHCKKISPLVLSLGVDKKTLESVLKLLIESEVFFLDGDFFGSNRVDKEFERRAFLSEKGKEGMRKRWGEKAQEDNPVNNPPITSKGDKEKKGKKNKGDKEEKRKKEYAELMNHVFFSDLEFSELWEEFLDVQKKDKTCLAKTRALKSLFEFSLSESKNALKTAVAGEHSGLYPKKSMQSVGEKLLQSQEEFRKVEIEIN